MKEIMTSEEAALIVQQLGRAARASVADALAQRPFSVQIFTVDLATAKLSTNPMKISGQFKSLYIQSATDTIANVQILLGSRDTTQSAFTMKQNDAISTSQPVAEAYMYWAAQTGKTLTFVTFTDVEFRSGSQISVSGGGVSINTGTTVTGPTQVALTAVTATIVIPVNTSRKQATLQNKTGADLYLGGSTIGAVAGANEGLKIPADGFYVWTNTAALYGWSVGGGNISYIEEV